MLVSIGLFACSSSAASKAKAVVAPQADPTAVAQQFYAAVDRKDPAAAAALFAASGVFQGTAICRQGCTGRAAIEQALRSSPRLQNGPFPMVYDQLSPSTVLASGQGQINRARNTYFVERIVVNGDHIAILVPSSRSENEPCESLVQPNRVCAQPASTPP
jgi:hypothetical protein